MAKEYNSREYQRRLERDVIIGAIVIGVVVGTGLIYAFWGANAAIPALGCFVLLAGLSGVVWGFLVLIGRLGNSQ